MASFFNRVRDVYRQTNKPNDFLFNRWVCRPVAAVLVCLLKDTRITPNQVTFLSLLTAFVAQAILLFWHSHVGLILAALVLVFAFILDCTDGQLARMRGQASSIGGLLDFLMDEIKAVSLVATISGRLAWMAWIQGQSGHALQWLAVGIAGVVVVSCGIALTTFMRRPEYLALSTPPTPGAASQKTTMQKVIAAVELGGRWVINYPSWIWMPAFVGRIEWFLIPYLGVLVLYLGYAGLRVVLKLGRFAR